MENIFTKLFKGEQAAQIGVNVHLSIDNETILRLCVYLLIVAVIAILLIKLF